MKRQLLCLGLLLCSGVYLHAQVTFPVNGTTDPKHLTYAFTRAKIVVDYKTVIDSATLLVRDGVILDAGKGITVPADAVVYDVSGRTIYPSLIDIFSDFGIPQPGKASQNDAVLPQFLSNTKGAYSWNQP
jgi:imidazolonepropionase-like amidohydrolase